MMPDLLSLETLDLTAFPQAGRKAATLGALKRAGFTVPDGHVLDANWFAAWAKNDLDRDALRGAIRQALSDLGPGPLAVRSSGVAEDGDGRSMAGCFDSTLGVQDVEQAVDAVLACWSSAVRARETLALDAGGMAALIQRQVTPTAAGVAFTADPVTGDRDVVCIEAVRGLGEALMAGTVDGERWRVRESATPSGVTTGVLTADEAARVARTARSIADELGTPSDVEWALVDGEVVILQARAITALPAAPIPIVQDPPEGFWVRDDHCPNPTPLTWKVWYETYPQQMTEVLKSCGVPVERMEATSYKGQAYTRIVTGGGDGPPPPGPVLWLVSRLLPTFRKAERRLREFLANDEALGFIDAWDSEHEPALSARVRALQAVDLTALDDRGLLDHLDACADLISDAGGVHATLGAAYIVPMGLLWLAGEDLMGWSDIESGELVAGYSTGTTQVDRELAELAAPWADDPRLHRGGWAEVRDALPELAERVDRWCAWEGQRRLDYDLSNPLFAEVPDLLLSRLRNAEATLSRLDAQRTRALDNARQLLDKARAALGPAEFAAFQKVVTDARRATHNRDANALVSVHLPAALFKHAGLELGRRLVAVGALEAPEHYLFTHPDEWPDALAGRAPELRQTVARRRGEYSWSLANPAPEMLGTKPADPDFSWFPPSLRTLFRMFSRMDDPPEVETDGTELIGLAAGGGVTEGTVRLLRSPTEIHRLQPGDVLVCECTSATWAVAYGVAGAIVTDRGSMMSHPAILAREYGLPAVLGTHHATRVLVDGQRVRVDGRAGRVEVL